MSRSTNIWQDGYEAGYNNDKKNPPKDIGPGERKEWNAGYIDGQAARKKRLQNTGDQNMQIKNAFTRGQMRALNAIQEKMDAVGIKEKVENNTPQYFDPDMTIVSKFDQNGKSILIAKTGNTFGVYARGNGQLLRGDFASVEEAEKFAKNR